MTLERPPARRSHQSHRAAARYASRHRRALSAIGAAAALLAAAVVPGGSASTAQAAAPAARPAVATATLAGPTAPAALAPATSYTISAKPTMTTQIFGPASAWRADVRQAPVNRDSTVMVADLAKQVKNHYGGTAAFNVWKYGATIVRVPKSQKRVTVHFDDCQHKGYTPHGLYDGLKEFVSVPIPASAKPSAGTDAGMTIWSPDTDQLWSFWKFKHAADGWHACWGGRIDHLSSNPGYFPSGFGASASGLAAGGAIRIDEVRNGLIPHAISIGILDYAGWKNISWPAQRSDGNSNSRSRIMMGTRFRLPASVNVDKLPLTPIGKLIAKAAQQYGFIVTEKSGAVAVPAESGAQIQARTGVNPWTDLMGGVPSYSIMKNFPWSQLQALPKDYGKH